MVDFDKAHNWINQQMSRDLQYFAAEEIPIQSVLWTVQSYNDDGIPHLWWRRSATLEKDKITTFH